MTRLYAGLIWRSLKGSPGATALSVLVVAVATATGYGGLAMGPALERPWDRAFAAANGPHLVIAGPPEASEAMRDAARAAGAVAADEAPRRTYLAGISLGGATYGAFVVSMTSVRPAVDRPVLTSGRWLDEPGEVVLERTFARHHDVGVGDHLTLSAEGETRVSVVGTASVVTREPYPRTQPGVVFALPETIAAIGAGDPLLSAISVRLAAPDSARSVAERVQAIAGPQVDVTAWQELRQDALAEMRPLQTILLSFASLLLLASGAVLLIALAAKVLARAPEIALLRAVGLTPRDTAILACGELVSIVLVGAAAGIAAGHRVALGAAAPTELALDAPGNVPFSGSAALAVVLTSLAVAAALGAFGAARAARGRLTAAPTFRATVAARLARRVARPSVYLGAAQAFARRSRALVCIAALTLTAISIVAALNMEATFARSEEIRAATAPDVPPMMLGSTVLEAVPPAADEGRLRALVYPLTAILVVIGLASIASTALLMFRERTRDVGIMKAIGLTPRDVAVAAVTGGVALALVAAVLGVPLGLAFFRGAYAAAGGSPAEIGSPSAVALTAAIAACGLLGGAGVSGVAVRAARMSPVTALGYE